MAKRKHLTANVVPFTVVGSLQHVTVVEAKRKFSRILANAELRGKCTVIEKRGRAIGVICPVSVIERPPAPPLTEAQIAELYAGLGSAEYDGVSAVADLFEGRR